MIEGRLIRRVEIHQESLCRSCGAEIVWALSERGRPQPVNVEREERGNIMLVHRENGQPPTAKVLSAEERATLARSHEFNLARGIDDGNDKLYLAHHATCPQGAAWRRRR